MEFWLWFTVFSLLTAVLYLAVRLRLIKRSAEEVLDAIEDSLSSDTNVLISISSRDRSMRKLADRLNKELKKLNYERRRYQMGDWELKDTITGISHDLRTPLTAVCGYLDLLEKENLSRDAARYVKIIRSRTMILRQLTEELFRYTVSTAPTAGADGISGSPVIINRVLEDSISTFYAALTSRKITPEICICEEIVTRILNRSALSRIFGNIISNALKYSDGDLHITLEENGAVTFSNHASRLDEVKVGRLFDRFYTVETASHESTGLGLSIARALTGKMHGTITAEYENGMLTVRVIFPD